MSSLFLCLALKAMPWCVWYALNIFLPLGFSFFVTLGFSGCRCFIASSSFSVPTSFKLIKCSLLCLSLAICSAEVLLANKCIFLLGASLPTLIFWYYWDSCYFSTSSYSFGAWSLELCSSESSLAWLSSVWYGCSSRSMALSAFFSRVVSVCCSVCSFCELFCISILFSTLGWFSSLGYISNTANGWVVAKAVFVRLLFNIICY